MIRVVAAVILASMLLSSPAIAGASQPDTPSGNQQQSPQQVETTKSISGQAPAQSDSGKQDQEDESSKPTEKSDWTATKIIGTIIAIPLIPVVLGFELVSGVTKHLPESTPIFAGDIVRGIAGK